MRWTLIAGLFAAGCGGVEMYSPTSTAESNVSVNGSAPGAQVTQLWWLGNRGAEAARLRFFDDAGVVLSPTVAPDWVFAPLPAGQFATLDVPCIAGKLVCYGGVRAAAEVGAGRDGLNVCLDCCRVCAADKVKVELR